MDEETRTFSDIFTALRTSRSVWFKRVYGGTSVPFPLLWLGGPGSGFEPVVDVGLPVTAGILEDLQDAGIGKRCECCAAQSRAGQGAGSDSDSRSGLGSWVVDGAQVTVENGAEWDAFVGEVAAQLRAVLGLELGLPQPPQNATKINGSKHRTVARKGKGAHGRGAQDPKMKMKPEPGLKMKLKPKLKMRLRSLVFSGAGAAGSCETHDHAPTAPRQDCEPESERVLATALFVLPSEYQGTGAVRISHCHGGEASEVAIEHNMDSEPASSSSRLCNTTVIAWRACDLQARPGETRETRETMETTVRVDPILEGCRASLVYDLVDTSESPSAGSLGLLPQTSVELDSDSDVRAQLERALHSWAHKDEDEDMNVDANAHSNPTIVYLLEGTYPRTNLSARALEGSDARLVALLDAVGAPLGVRVGLASVTGTRVGVVYDEGERELLGMGDASTTVEVENLVALDGAFVREGVLEMRGGRVVDAGGGHSQVMVVPTGESFRDALFEREEAEERVGGISERSVECEYHGTALILWR